MPLLVVLVMIIAVFALTIKHTDADGITRTGLDGLKVYVIPDFASMTFEKFSVYFLMLWDSFSTAALPWALW